MMPLDLTPERVGPLIAQLVRSCFQDPLVNQVRAAAERYVAYEFLNGTRYEAHSPLSRHHAPTSFRDTGRPYDLASFRDIHDFLTSPNSTHPAQGDRTDEFEFDVITTTIDHLVIETLAHARAHPQQYPRDLVFLANAITPTHPNAQLVRWYDLVDAPLADTITETIVDALYDNSGFLDWMTGFLQEPLEPIIEKHAEHVRLVREEEHARKAAIEKRTAMLEAKAHEWLAWLGPTARERFEADQHQEAWELVQRVLAAGAAPEELHALLSLLNLSHKVRKTLEDHLHEREHIHAPFHPHH